MVAVLLLHDLEYPVTNALEKLTATTKKCPRLRSFSGMGGRASTEPARSQHGLLLPSALKVYKRSIAKCSVMISETSPGFGVGDSADDLFGREQGPLTSRK